MKIIPIIIFVFFYNLIFSQSEVDTTDVEYIKRTKDVIITDKSNIKIRTSEEEFEYQKLKSKVIKLYPYALLARQIYTSSNEDLSKMESNKERKKYMKKREEDLRNRFENEIKALYVTDGPILVKLVHKETGKTCHEILKESKGGLKSWVYQIVAKRYGYSLKDTFDPINNPKDQEIENIVNFLKEEGQLPVYFN